MTSSRARKKVRRRGVRSRENRCIPVSNGEKVYTQGFYCHLQVAVDFASERVGTYYSRVCLCILSMHEKFPNSRGVKS